MFGEVYGTQQFEDFDVAMKETEEGKIIEAELIGWLRGKPIYNKR